jgi:hypothetical protein
MSPTSPVRARAGTRDRQQAEQGHPPGGWRPPFTRGMLATSQLATKLRLSPGFRAAFVMTWTAPGSRPGPRRWVGADRGFTEPTAATEHAAILASRRSLHYRIAPLARTPASLATR